MLHISICDDEIVAVEKMRKIVGKVLEQEQLLANVGTFEKWGRIFKSICNQRRRIGDIGFGYADKKWNRCHTGA